jgi:translocation and assembly module TamB
MGLAAVVGLSVVLAIVGAIVGGLRSESGTAWLLARVPGLELRAPKGALLGERLVAERIVFRWANGAGHVEILDFEASGLRWHRVWGAGPWFGGTIDRVSARQVRVQMPPSSGQPPAQPASLRLPVALAIAHAEIGSLTVDALAPVTAIRATTLHIGADAGARHRIEGLTFDWDRVQAHDGRATLATDAPFALDAVLEARAREGRPWQARAELSGPLDTLALKAALRGEPVPDHAAPALDAQLQLLPFEAWPLGAMSLQSRALDLAALSSSAPATRLDIQAQVVAAKAGAPWSAELTLANALPGRWDQGRLPLRSASATLRTDPRSPTRGELPAFELRLADGSGEAGRWHGQARWDGTTLQLDSRLDGLRPQRLDGRAAAMRLSGPLTVSARGLPLPAATAASAASAASAPAAAPGDRWRQLEADIQGRFEGSLDGVDQAVSLAFDARASTRQIELTRVEARAGQATADGTALLQLQAGQRWQLASQGRLQRFDPLPWFPGPEGSAWRRGPHRLTGTWNLDLALPERTLRLPPLRWLQSLQGEGQLQISDSLLAGVPLQGQLRLQRDPAAATAQRSQASGELRLGSNRLTLQGRGDPAARGDDDRWQLELQAPALAELAPLMALQRELADWAPRQGAMQARLTAQGRWPAMRSEGEAQVQGLRANQLTLARGSVRWALDNTQGQTLDLQTDLTQLAWGAQRIEAFQGQVQGTLAAHRITATLTAPVQPPPQLVRALGLRSGAGAQLQLDGSGAWLADAAGGGTWRGRVQRLAAGAWDGTAARTTDGAWLDTGDLQADLRFGPDWRPVAFNTPSGRARLAGGIGLRWSDIHWRGDVAAPELRVQAEIEPVAVAPILQRLLAGTRDSTQWGGDLRATARLDLRVGERFDADLSLRRHDGDLNFNDGGTPQWLGLSDADFTLAAHDGEWRFTPVFIGRMLGAISGAVTARTTPQARWPGRDAVLEGAVGAEVPNLAVWAGWLPPGWRIDGAASATARLAGTLGAPQYTGELLARGVGIRNLLQGVALSEGEMQVVLQGDSARIERLRIRGGDGTLTATGRASLGSAPQALLEVQADRLRVLGRVDRQLVISGRSSLALQADRLRLDGKLAVDSGLFDLTARDAPSLDDDVTVIRNGTPGSMQAAQAAPPGLMRTAVVALDIDLGRQLRLRGRGLDTTLTGQLQLSAPGGRLAVNGTVRAENGTYAAYGQKLAIERGLVAFAGPLDGARLDILALRPNLDLRVGVAITGTALNPRVRLISEPEMSETDKLSWLVLGRGPDGLGRTDTALLQRAAVALLAGEGEGPTDALLSRIGLDDLSVRQTDGEVRETVITLGKQLSQRWYVGYERGVNATTGTWQLIYRIAQRFTLRAQSGLENSLDLIWTWRFGER